ncbi:N-acetyl-1-D-myo-inositol-2-amino-2-deoxy-alpha-D-glucopyranoside deacetylase [Leekyejoonella antrihumi]|uniref:N-acetyl-1-D-myo-inositol-2-amino-2-deoxy-alpha-D-glucopyranoside deacetylase n=1 Tax=Leekyejoonella antrihumi TaxID=1660198 RepID=A0A563DUL8_9MICO|nr:N-acetyl-1-D-myo-inositol-2-amino-2-deoxy-alpha-D-glucopyranoside deacetylase [Leekyejoonella antrihumi]TWP33876.1 N-acetyl-1-D-myo-inositol-2-amino-2-deoxy-alpha-D-glucopyranoside deacetylase [Leekyejoonella antrihumi]
MLVHAHPDDESSSTGATMARYVAEGAAVTLVTCTLGELGEVVVPELAHLAADQEGTLAAHRQEELAAAMAELGVTDFVRLGGDGRWRDSGMAYDEKRGVVPMPDTHDESFWRADLLEAANELVALIRDRRPQVLITYDENGHYGHPDHIQAHRVAMYAASLAAVPSHRRDLGEPWAVQRILWIAMSESMIRTMIRQAREAGESNDFFDSFDIDSDEPPMMSVRDSDIDVRVDGYPYAAQRFAALRSHKTQIAADEFFFKFEDAPAGPLWEECYRFAGGIPFDGPSDDLFAGLDR